MTYTCELAHRGTRFRAVAAALTLLFTIACDNEDRLAPVEANQPTAADSTAGLPSDTLSDAQVALNETNPSFYTGSTAPGIGFGPFSLPSTMYGSTFTSSVQAVGPDYILSRLAAARRAGARLVLRLAGGDSYYQNSDGTLNLTKWKARVARYKYVDIAPYIKDGTLLAHYLVDEPHDPSNWGGKPVPFSTLEAMAKYSKSIWPGLTTVVRAYPDWLSKASFRWYYLDASWAQYSYRKGEVNAWIKGMASYAKNEGLGLIVGLNYLNGGTSSSGIKGTHSGSYAMSASQVKSAGAALVANPQACAMLSWKYTSTYFGRSDIKSANSYLGYKAKNRSRTSCRL